MYIMLYLLKSLGDPANSIKNSPEYKVFLLQQRSARGSRHRKRVPRGNAVVVGQNMKKIAMPTLPLRDHTPSRFSSVGVEAFPALELLLLERDSLLTSRRGALRALMGGWVPIGDV